MLSVQTFLCKNRWQRIDNIPATRRHEQTGEMAFFNNVISRYLNAIKAGSLEPPYLNKKGKLQPPAFVSFKYLPNIRARADQLFKYGDGTQIPHKYLDLAVKIVEYVPFSICGWCKHG
jgi:hypothetical protein